MGTVVIFNAGNVPRWDRARHRTFVTTTPELTHVDSRVVPVRNDPGKPPAVNTNSKETSRTRP